MILLKELLDSIDKDNKSGMICIDNWKLSEVEYLHNVGFIFEDDYKMSTPKPPIISIYKKKDSADDKKSKGTFYLEEPDKSIKTFNEFKDMISYFDNYSQSEIDDRE
jgi:hypothetical protein